ncbi:MAG: aldo/keto reductase [Deltaproteobacteria bacterium]|nr:aldo/keto reductase [Deltaproteobacteria bacterium]
MFFTKIGRRRFITSASSAFLGVAVAPFLNARSTWAKTEKMVTPEYRILGKTGLRVTAVAMGVMNCSDPAVLHRAYDLGVNFYDTANVYMAGKNEEMVGKVFRGKRDKVLIQTKIRFKPTEQENRESIETSLRRLQTDYVDVLLWHALQTPEEVANPEAFEFMQKLKKEGKVRFHGFSSHSDMASLLREGAKSSVHDVALVSYNFTHSNELKEAVGIAAKSGIGVVAMKTQAGGYKTEKIGSLSPHQAALRIVLTDHNISTAIPGVTTIEQIDECAAVMGTELSREDLGRLDQYHSYLHGRICTMCGGCIGACPHGVAHSDLLRAVMYRDAYQDDRLVHEMFDDEDRRQKIRQCAECSSCFVRCRRGLDIHAQLRSVHTMLL